MSRSRAPFAPPPTVAGSGRRYGGPNLRQGRFDGFGQAMDGGGTDQTRTPCEFVQPTPQVVDGHQCGPAG